MSVVGYRVALDVLPFRWVHRFAARSGRSAGPVRVDDYAWAVQAAARRIPRASCLTQALALQSLLARAGESSRLRLGVAKDDGKFEAHAWLESGGRVVIGGRDVDRFAQLPLPPQRGAG
jgi:Transglutaminase-like superfamily